MSLELIIVSIIMKAVNHNYTDRPSWDNLEIHNYLSNFLYPEPQNPYFYLHSMTCIKSKPVTPSSVLLRTHAHAHTHTHKQAQTNTHTHTHTLATAVLPLFELPLEVLFVMAVRPAVAFC